MGEPPNEESAVAAEYKKDCDKADNDANDDGEDDDDDDIDSDDNYHYSHHYHHYHFSYRSALRTPRRRVIAQPWCSDGAVMVQ